jgi:flagellar basal body-associated protein FliL
MGKGERERERLREERIAAEESEKSSGRSRLIIGYAVVSTVVLVAAVLVFVLVSGGDDSSGGEGKDDGGAHINLNEEVGNTNGVQPDERAGIVPAAAKVTDLKTAANRANCELRLELPDEGHTHLPQNSKPPNYKTSPPSSGNHVEAPYQQADGAYSEPPEQLNAVHSLEHGRLAIEYSPDLPEQAQLELKGLYDTMYGATLFFPNDEMVYDVAAVTWTNLLTCREYKGAATLDAIRAFGKETWGKYGGEPVEAFNFTGPTPAEPDEP